jgi:hypothetical protein
MAAAFARKEITGVKVLSYRKKYRNKLAKVVLFSNEWYDFTIYSLATAGDKRVL